MSIRLGYLGPRGTFSEEATRRYVATANMSGAVQIPYRTIPDVLMDVAAGELERGVVPAENSIEGSVAVTLDYLVHHVTLKICGELVIPISLSLLTRPDSELDEITTVYSHPQPLAQCRHNLQKLLPKAQPQPVSSTAEGARLVKAGGDRHKAALGNDLAGALYGLQVAARNLQDVNGNATRFLVVAKDDPQPTGRDKTSLAFGFSQDQPGNLYRALEAFASRNMNLTKLESRPAKRSLGDYLFFVDLEGHADDAKVAAALADLRKRCDMVKVLGSYPRADY